MADKQKEGVLPQGYNQGQQQSEKDTLLEDNCSWGGLETQRCSSALRQGEEVGVVVVRAQRCAKETGVGREGPGYSGHCS